MKVTNVERVLVDVPFTPRQQQITTQSVSTVYNWSILELCKVTTDTGHVGWGETVVHYTYSRVSDASVERVLGQSPADTHERRFARCRLTDGTLRCRRQNFGSTLSINSSVCSVARQFRFRGGVSTRRLKTGQRKPQMPWKMVIPVSKTNPVPGGISPRR